MPLTLSPLSPSPAFHVARRSHPGAGAPEFVEIQLEAETLTLTCSAQAGVWHYFRWADGTLKPLPPQPEPISFEPGDTYIALSPSARHISDSPSVARFLHLHDNFNAEKLAAGLLTHLIENADRLPFSEEVTVLVIEVR